MNYERISIKGLRSQDDAGISNVPETPNSELKGDFTFRNVWFIYEKSNVNRQQSDMIWINGYLQI